MSRYRIRAKNAKSAKRKATTKTRVVTKVNYIPGTKKGGMKTFDVITRKRQKKK